MVEYDHKKDGHIGKSWRGGETVGINTPAHGAFPQKF